MRYVFRYHNNGIAWPKCETKRRGGKVHLVHTLDRTLCARKIARRVAQFSVHQEDMRKFCIAYAAAHDHIDIEERPT